MKPKSSGHEEKVKSQPEAMALLVERWLGNPIFRTMLKFCTVKCKICGRRIDVVLKKYAGGDVRLCKKCSIAYSMVSRFLDTMIKKANMDEAFIKESLKDFMFRKGLASVLEGLAEFGLKKPFTSYSPFLFVWNVTDFCNLKCRHCYQSAGKLKEDELDTKQALEVVDKLADAGVTYIALSGGEPLTRKDFYRIAERMKEREIAFSIATNGVLLTKENVKKLKKLDCRYIQVSLDGADAKTHDWFRGRNVFKKTIQGIKNAVDSDITVGISTTITKHNYHQHKDFVGLAEKLKVDIWMHYNFIPAGRGKEIKGLDITPKQREELLRYLARKTNKSSVKLLSTAPQYGRVTCEMGAETGIMTHFDTFSSTGDSRIGFLADFIGGCGAGRLYAALDPNGDLYPCVFLRIKIGNALQDDIGKIWRKHSILKKLRNRKDFKHNCGKCTYRNRCGGCRARAFGYFKDIQAADPGCIRNERLWKKVEKGK